MTSAPDSGDIADPTLPRDPADYAPARRPGFGAAFWTAIIIGLVLIAAGAIIGFFGARLFPVHPAAQVSAESGAPPLPVSDPTVAIAPAQGSPPTGAGPAQSPAELAALGARIDQLQTNQRRTAQASAEALAAADLQRKRAGLAALRRPAVAPGPPAAGFCRICAPCAPWPRPAPPAAGRGRASSPAWPIAPRSPPAPRRRALASWPASPMPWPASSPCAASTRSQAPAPTPFWPGPSAAPTTATSKAR